MTFAPSRRIETTNAIQQLPELSDLLAVSRALARADDVTLEQLVRTSPQPEEVYHQIRLTAPFASHALGNVGACEHSALWVIPITTSRGSKPASRQGSSSPAKGSTLVAQWISDWFGFRNQARYFNFIPTYEVIARLTAGEVRRALDVLVRPSAFAIPRFKIEKGEATDRCFVPELAFILGSVSQLNEPPIFPGDVGGRAHALQEKLCGELAFQNEERAVQTKSYWAGTPAVFSEGVLEGLLLWIAAVQAGFTTEDLDVHPSGFDDVTLEWTVRCNESNQRLLLTKHLRYSQLGAEGVESVISATAHAERSAMKAHIGLNA
ncbi:hypothetical protein LJR066_006873 [Acidovorax sp. LjRoot66]|uniref:hypothetical protein n=1 Tax=Acidovorax sp. LjRoot66 TaxID=3342334 RepID=UPI003ECD9B68